MNIHTNIKEIIKKYGRGIINLIIAVGVSFILSARSLYFSTGQFGIEMFKSYFANVYTIILNTAPILFVILILLVIVNRLWISVGIASILVIVLSLINYFKLSFRDDPLLVEDLSLFFEMRNMTERYKIHISSSMLMWIAGMVVITFILWKIRKQRRKKIFCGTDDGREENHFLREFGIQSCRNLRNDSRSSADRHPPCDASLSAFQKNFCRRTG